MKTKKLLVSSVAFFLAMNAGALHVAHAEGRADMRAALESLRSSKKALEDAGGGKGGHRVKAIELVEQAIEQVKAGIEYDKSH